MKKFPAIGQFVKVRMRSGKKYVAIYSDHNEFDIFMPDIRPELPYRERWFKHSSMSVLKWKAFYAEEKILLKFMSGTYPGEEVQFYIYDWYRNEKSQYSEDLVKPKLDSRFNKVAEDLYEFSGTFEEGKQTLIGLGFIYSGPACVDMLS